MAVQVRFTSSGTVGVNVELGTTDSLMVLNGVTLSSTGNNAVQGTGSKHIVTVQGIVLASGIPIRIGGSPVDTFGQVVSIKATGTAICTSSGFAGVAVFGHDSAVYNDGLIQGDVGVDIFGVGGIGRIYNTGTIQGSETGILAEGAQIVEIFNSGTIAGDIAGLSFLGATADITNAGHIVGDIVLGAQADIYHGLGGRLLGAIFGNGGNDIIETGVDDDIIDGGTGADIMAGGKGNDSYIVDNIGDVVDESRAGSNGRDLITSSVNISLAPTANAAVAKGSVENIILDGSGNIFAYGNALANTLIGNDNSNVLAGGLGNDTLIGSGDNDFFLFNTAPNTLTNVDRITDMNEVGNDTIRLENAIFTTLSAGALPGSALRIGAAAADADDRIVYYRSTGELFYDADGNGAGASVRFAILDPGLTLTVADFFVV